VSTESDRGISLGVHHLVRLQFGVGVDARSRVEELDGDDVWIAAPTDGAYLLHRHGEDDLALEWMAPRGRVTQAVKVVGIESGHIETWRLRKVGEPRVEQLREFVRVETAIPISATLLKSDDGAGQNQVFKGTTIDISEGGVRCMLATKDAGVSSLQPDAEVVVHLTLEGRPLDIPAKVLRGLQGLHGKSEVVFVFAASQYGDDIRRFVFATQIRARAASRS
jgi:hypothetical protein